jgi:hypothetical protein
MVPSPLWFLYGFVRKKAVVSSQIEGTHSTLEDVISFELNRQPGDVSDVEEVCNYVDALNYARAELARPKGLRLSTRLVCEIHKRLMKGVRGQEKQPGKIRTSQNWIGGTRPGNAKFVPPPPDSAPALLADLDKWTVQRCDSSSCESRISSRSIRNHSSLSRWQWACWAFDRGASYRALESPGWSFSLREPRI